MIPDYCEAITAWRVWDVHANGLLAGQAAKEAWPPYEPLRATCAGLSEQGATGHLRDGRLLPAPIKGCGCGVHAFLTEEAAERRARNEDGTLSWRMRGDLSVRAWGSVKLWGRIIVHEQGYRAEYAYPSALHCENKELAVKVSDLYGVPCDHRILSNHDASDDHGLGYLKTKYAPINPKQLGVITGISTPQASSPSSYYFFGKQWALTQPPLPPQPTGMLYQPSDAQVDYMKQLGAQPHQIRGAMRGGKTQDWREILKQMVVKVKDSADADPYTIGKL